MFVTLVQSRTSIPRGNFTQHFRVGADSFVNKVLVSLAGAWMETPASPASDSDSLIFWISKSLYFSSTAT